MGFYKNTHSGVHTKKEKIYDELLKISHSISFPRGMLQENIIFEEDGSISLRGSIDIKSGTTMLPYKLNCVYGSFSIGAGDCKLFDLDFPLECMPKRVCRWVTIYGRPQYNKEDILGVVEVSDQSKIHIVVKNSNINI